MILKLIPFGFEDTGFNELPELDMVVDPRPVYAGDKMDFKFQVSVNRMALTVTRTDEGAIQDWPYSLNFRVYCRNEFRYSFESTKYLYHGLDGEYAPRDATEIIVKDGVERIKRFAFRGCLSLSKITMPNSVTHIEFLAFESCESLRHIQLPPNIEYVGSEAFCQCVSLEEIYIPPTVRHIGCGTFRNCKSLRILNIPKSVKDIQLDEIRGCDGLLSAEMKEFIPSLDQQCRLLKNRYNPLHDLCWDPSVTAHNIQQYIQTHDSNEEAAATNDKPQFSPFHLLVANPSVTTEMITTYLQLAPDVAVMQDDTGATSLHMLCSARCFSDDSGDLIRAYLDCEEGRTAAFMKDNEGKTPFDRLCERDFEEMMFLRNKSLHGLMVWWYDCLGINFLAICNVGLT